MHILPEFLLRIIGFAVTFYYLLEYILTCQIDTKIGLFITLVVCIIIIIFFKFYTCDKVSKCQSCNSTIIKNNILDNLNLMY